MMESSFCFFSMASGGVSTTIPEIDLEPTPLSSARCVVPCSADSIFLVGVKYYTHRICNIIAFRRAANQSNKEQY